MIRIIRRLLGLCEHKWKTILTRDVRLVSEYSSSYSDTIEYHQQCEHCGDLQSKTF